ncbi:MAG: VacJ family lipoprotein [Gammaproteobacteria bacterium]|nr:VacJ family lipoprotein [Gammaproteobacteria bacterium]
MNRDSHRPTRLAGAASLLMAIGLLAGCASNPGNTQGVSGAERDPLAPINREIYRFNMLLDAAVLRPAAVGYETVTPEPVETGISNFFDNLSMPITIINDLLQLKPLDAVRDTGRFLVNSTVGLAGFLDPASGWNMPEHSEDFGITLARWGVPSGPYLQLPFLGPSTVRDVFGLYVDHFASFYYWTGWDPATRNAVTAVGIVQLRAQFLELDKMLTQSYDPYALMRNTWLQQRAKNVRENLPDYDPNALPNYYDLPAGDDGG